MGAPRPFAHLRVLELSTEIAGPYATKLLADLGADVLKLETPSGDPLRRRIAARVALPDGDDGALFRFLNAGKRSARYDGSDAADRTRLRELARPAADARLRARQLLARRRGLLDARDDGLDRHASVIHAGCMLVPRTGEPRRRLLDLLGSVRCLTQRACDRLDLAK